MQVCQRRIRPASVEKSRRGDFSHTGRRCQTRLTATAQEAGMQERYTANTSMHFGRYGRRLNRRQARVGGGGMVGCWGRSWKSRLAALRRQRGHRSCRGFPRSSSLSPGVYLRERSLYLYLALPFARRGGDLSFIRNRRDVRIHGYSPHGLSGLAVIFQWCQEPWPAPHTR